MSHTKKNRQNNFAKRNRNCAYTKIRTFQSMCPIIFAISVVRWNQPLRFGWEKKMCLLVVDNAMNVCHSHRYIDLHNAISSSTFLVFDLTFRLIEGSLFHSFSAGPEPVAEQWKWKTAAQKRLTFCSSKKCGLVLGHSTYLRSVFLYIYICGVSLSPMAFFSPMSFFFLLLFNKKKKCSTNSNMLAKMLVPFL